MRLGIIDVGSNTIRMVIYEISGESFSDIANERDFASLITYVEDGILSTEGRKRIVKTLSDMGKVCEKNNCDEICCFATASLRNVKNIDEVIAEIKEKTGINMEIISGEDEAKYDFYGLISAINDENGIGFDLGGGSGQLFKFSDKKLDFFGSLKIGGQVIYKKFVSKELPDEAEIRKIYDYIKAECEKFPEMKNAGFSTLYAMGGAARNAAKYLKLTRHSEKSLENFKISKDELKNLISEIALSKQGREKLLKIMPERLTTLVPGMVTICAMLDFTGAEHIQIVLNGVREGFLYEKVLKK